ncbi:MAG: hypothetical protein WCZ66_09865 [Sphingomonadaceae bacterium]
MFEEEKAVVQRWLDLVRGDREAVWESYKTMHPDMTWTLIGTTPASGTHRGLQNINDNFQEKCWNGDGRPGSGPQGLDFEVGINPLEIEELVALEDGRVMVHCHSNAMGKNGVPYKNEYCWILTVKDDKIVSLYEFCDTALLERSLFDKKIIPAELVPNL